MPRTAVGEVGGVGKVGKVGEALEPLALADDPWPAHPATPASAGDRRRWPVVLIAAAVVGVAVAVPIRLQFARSELAQLEHRFAGYALDDDATKQVLEQLRAATYPGDEALMRDAAAGVSLEEADLLDVVDRGLAGGFVVDGRLGALRKEMRRFLRLRIGDLRAGRLVDPGTQFQLSRVIALLEAQRRRFGLTGSVPATALGPRQGASRAAVRFPAAAPALAVARHWLDGPTADSLLAVGDGLLRLDVGASRETRLSSVTPFAGQLVPRQGYVAYADGITVTAEDPNWQAPPRLIGRGVGAFAATRPDAVWVVADDSVTEVDGHGNQLVPPTPVAAVGFVASVAVGDTIAVQTQDQGLVLWNPRTQRTTCRVGGLGVPIAGGADLLAWIDTEGGLRVTTASTCVTKTLAVIGAQLFSRVLAASGSVSPDGRTLAGFVSTEAGGTPVFLLAIFDLASGEVTLPMTAGLSAKTLPIIWTADGRRVYYTVSTPGGADLPATYRLGDLQMHALRFRAPPGFYVAALIP